MKQLHIYLLGLLLIPLTTQPFYHLPKPSSLPTVINPTAVLKESETTLQKLFNNVTEEDKDFIIELLSQRALHNQGGVRPSNTYIELNKQYATKNTTTQSFINTVDEIATQNFKVKHEKGFEGGKILSQEGIVFYQQVIAWCLKQ
jgi:hypothetical protein